MDRPDILVGGDFGEPYEPKPDDTSSVDSPDVITPPPPTLPADVPTNTPPSESPKNPNVNYGGYSK